MTEEKKEDLPKFAFKTIPLGESIEMTLDCAKAVKTGEGKFGTSIYFCGYPADACQWGKDFCGSHAFNKGRVISHCPLLI